MADLMKMLVVSEGKKRKKQKKQDAYEAAAGKQKLSALPSEN